MSKGIDAKKQWCLHEHKDVVVYFGSSRDGLAGGVAAERLREYGKNELPRKNPDTFFRIFARQFQSPLLYVLMLAAVAALLLGEVTDGLVIAAVLIFNGVIGAIQEGKAQNSLFALQRFAKTDSLVVRDGRNAIIPSSDLVPGDIIIIKEGDKVPADARIIDSKSLALDEAALTGESTPVQKTQDILAGSDEVLVSDQTNMLWKGTHVQSGSGRAIVVATGRDTEIGKISEKISAIDSEIPLQASMARLARILIIATTLIIGLLFVVGVLTGNTPRDMLLVSISLMVSVIPEGLPIVMTLILARGVKRMSEQDVLVKRLQAVEALGQAKIIAVDKTGTLTKNELVVQKVYVNGNFFDITGVGYSTDGDAMQGSTNASDDSSLMHLAFLAGLSANAEIFRHGAEVKISGDPTEAALLVLGEKFDFQKKALLKKYPLVGEIPFDFKKKYYVNVHEYESDNLLISTGAAETVIAQCSELWTEKGPETLSGEKRSALVAEAHTLSQNGLRVIALATKHTESSAVDESDIEGLTFVGFAAMKDALRPEVSDAMASARGAGMQVVMITGDHVETATAIAREAGVYVEGDKVLSGTEVVQMDDETLAEAVDGVTVFARVTPDQKLRIIEAYKRRGHIIAMTGDGVNDVPSLVAADLGVAMGGIGTEVTKEAADIVLLDDNFGNIPKAVAEGRSIFQTIKKTLLYLFSTNLAELLVIVFAVIFLLPIPLTPAQIVWLNLVTDSFLVMTLAFLPRDPGLLQGRFKKPSKYVLDRMSLVRLVLFAAIITIGTLGVFIGYQQIGFSLEISRTMAFITLSVFQIFRLWSVRSNTVSVFAENPLTLPWMFAASLAAVGLQMMAVYAPFMQKLLETATLRPFDWLVAVGVGGTIVIVDEVRKVFARRKRGK